MKTKLESAILSTGKFLYRIATRPHTKYILSGNVTLAELGVEESYNIDVIYREYNDETCIIYWTTFRDIREGLKMTQAEFAEALGMWSTNGYANYERDLERTLQHHVWDKLSALLGVSVDELVNGWRLRC